MFNCSHYNLYVYTADFYQRNVSGLLRVNLELHKPVGEDEAPQARRLRR